MQFRFLVLFLVVACVAGEMPTLPADPAKGTLDLELQRNLELGWSATKQYEISVVQAALFKAKMGDALAKINLFHAGFCICMKNADGSGCEKEFGVDYVALTTPASAIFPLSDPATGKLYTKNNNELVWANQGKMNYLPTCDRTYWTKFEKVATFTGEQYKKFAHYVASYLGQYPRYKLFKAMSLNKDKTLSESEFSSTCMDMVMRALTYMGAHMCLHPKEGINVVEVTAVDTSVPREVDLRNPRNLEAYQRWYLKAQILLKKVGMDKNALGSPEAMKILASKRGLLEKFVQETGGVFYIFVNDRRVQRLKLDSKNPAGYTYNKFTKPFGNPQFCNNNS